MSDVRKSVPAKVIASLLILVSVFSLCWQGMAVLRGIDYVSCSKVRGVMNWVAFRVITTSTEAWSFTSAEASAAAL